MKLTKLHLTESVSHTPTCSNCIAACCRNHDLIRVLPNDKTPMECYIHGGQRCFMKMIPDPQFGGKRCICLNPNTNKCTIYENRPTACREFKMGGPQCQYVRRELL